MTTAKNVNFYRAKESDLLDYHKDDIHLEINCHAIGTIQSFNATLQTAKATINYQKVVYQDTGAGVWGPVLFSYPLMVDCPVRYDFGSNGGVTVPYSEGDEVLVGFNDRDMDLWFSQGTTTQAPNTPRFHSFTDAIILGGISSLPNVIESFDASRPALRNGDGTSYVAIGDIKIEIAGNSTTLFTLLNQLISDIKSITTLNSDATTGVVSVASQAALAADASALGELLL